MPKAKKKPKAKHTNIQYLAEFKYEAEGVEKVIAEFPIAVPRTFEQLQVEQAKEILLRVLSKERGKITNIFLWTFTQSRSPEGIIKIEKQRLLMSSAIAPYSEFGKEAEAYVSPEDEEILKLIVACFLRSVSKPYPPLAPKEIEIKPVQVKKVAEIPMTKKEQQNIARSMVKTLQPMRIERVEKYKIYYSMVSGLALSEAFDRNHLFGFDVILDEVLREHKNRNKDRLLSPNIRSAI